MEQVTFEAENKRDVNLLIAIAEKIGIKKYVISKTGMVKNKAKRNFDFSKLYGKLEWKGDALAEQKKIRSEWK
ncbi:MAG: hypothetical protein ACTHM7_05740 [Ginsengibacter sp.]